MENGDGVWWKEGRDRNIRFLDFKERSHSLGISQCQHEATVTPLSLQFSHRRGLASRHRDLEASPEPR
jgi:hypothetical protein